MKLNRNLNVLSPEHAINLTRPPALVLYSGWPDSYRRIKNSFSGPGNNKGRECLEVNDILCMNIPRWSCPPWVVTRLKTKA